MPPKKRKPSPRKRLQTRRINKKAAFLASYKITANLTASAEIVGMNRHQHYEWLRKDAAYAAAFAQADVEAIQSLYDSAVHWSMVGIYNPTVHQGRFSYPREEYIAVAAVAAVTALDWKEEGGPRDAVAEVKEVRAWRDVPGAPPIGKYVRSERLHEAILKAKIPAFRASNVELTGAGGGPVEVSLAEVLRERKAKRETETVK
jgi:hypothetical protein